MTAERSKILFLSTAAVLAMLPGCSSAASTRVTSRTVEASAEGYANLSDLSKKSPVIVEGEVGGLVKRWLDRGGSQDPAVQGIPMETWTFVVSRAVKGNVEGTIQVLTTEASTDAALKRGAAMVLFVEPLTSATAPGLPPDQTFYVPLGGVNGLFDILDGTARSRGSVGLDGATANETPVFDLAKLRAAATSG